MPRSSRHALLIPGRREFASHLVPHIASFAALSLLAFYLNRETAFFRFDGTFLLNVVASQAHWMAPLGVFSMNPLEGNAGMWFPTAMQLIPGFAVGRLFGDELLPAVSFAWFATEFFVATLVLGRAAGVGRTASLMGAWALALGICPFLVPAPASERIWGNPHLLTAVAADALALSAFILVGRATAVRDGALAAAALALLGYIGFSQPVAAVLAWPVFGFFALASTLAAPLGRERQRKAAALAVAVVILVGLFGRYLGGLFAYAKVGFFWDELTPVAVGWRQQSFLLDYGSRFRWLGTAFWLAALAGAAACVRRGREGPRPFAYGFLGFVAIGMAVALAIHLGGANWRGPVPAYFDLFALPLYACFTGILMERAIGGWLGAHPRVATALPLLPWLVLAGWKAPYDIPMFRNQAPFPWPPKETTVSRFLQDDIGLRDGEAFRGRVASIAGADFNPELAGVPFASQHNYDAMTAFFAGNDHRMYGFWYFGIPTLIENNQFSSPFFHLLTSRLLAAPGIQHTRPQTTITRFDEKTLRQLGVRYVLADTPQPGKAPVLQTVLTPGRTQYLYAVAHPNVAGTSPVGAHVAADAAAAIAAVIAADFDFERTAVLFEPLPDGRPLVPAQPERLVFRRDSVRVAASSPGRSLLVLPLEYSRCLVSALRDDSADGAPRLLRANLSQVGILFEGRLTGEITLRFSPLENPTCRYHDFDDARRLRLGEAAAVQPQTAPAQR